MTIKLNDKTMASVRFFDGRSKVTFHGINKVIVLPVGTVLNVDLINKLYSLLGV